MAALGTQKLERSELEHCQVVHPITPEIRGFHCSFTIYCASVS